MNRLEISSTTVSLDWSSIAIDEQPAAALPPPVQVAVANMWEAPDAADRMQEEADNEVNGRNMNHCRAEDQALYMKIGRLFKGMFCWCCTS